MLLLVAVLCVDILASVIAKCHLVLTGFGLENGNEVAKACKRFKIRPNNSELSSTADD